MDYNLTIQADVESYMRQSNSESDWNNRADAVKDANGGKYPSFWFKAIIVSGLAAQVVSAWNN